MLGIVVPSHDLLMMKVLRLGLWHLSKGWGEWESHSPKTGVELIFCPTPPRKQRPDNASMVYFFHKHFSGCVLNCFGFPLPPTDLDEQLLDPWSLLKLGRRLKSHNPSPKSAFLCLLNWINTYDQKQQVTKQNKGFQKKSNLLVQAVPFSSSFTKKILCLAIGTAPAAPANEIIYQCHLGGWMWIVCWLQNVHSKSFFAIHSEMDVVGFPTSQAWRSATLLGLRQVKPWLVA